MTTQQTHTADPLPRMPVGFPAINPARSYVLPRWKRVALLGLPVFLLLVSWVAPTAIMLRSKAESATHAADRPVPSGIALYAKHCAHCHGVRGNGAGPTGANLWPRPRNFREGRFRLVTTPSGIPTDDDLLAVLRNGIPGSSMPDFRLFSESELRALIEQVRDLTFSGAIERFEQLAEQGDIEPEDVYRRAAERCAPGPVLAIPKQFPPPTPASLARGAEVYSKICASCHGPAGRGDGPQVGQLVNTDGSRARPRDLTLGRFKGGSDPAHVYARIMLGLPGSPMPATNTLPQDEILNLINYVLSLSQPNSTARTPHPS